ncbi:MAG: hypothetical protein JSR65_13250 [Proteobacteria bacterium]|nr:hypothetical protein [Pseudomonadota bacterium]
MNRPVCVRRLHPLLHSLVALGLLSSPMFASAQNLLANGTFDTNIAGWTATYANWDSTHDANNNPHSGALQIVATSQSSNGGLSSSQCVPVTAGQSYTLSAQIILPAAFSTVPGNASLTVFWSANPTCAPSYTGQFSTTPVVWPGPVGNLNGLDTWYGVSASQMAPPGTQSALVDLISYAQTTGGAFTADFDNVVFQPATTAVPAPAMGPFALALCALLMLAGAIGYRMRTRQRP